MQKHHFSTLQIGAFGALLSGFLTFGARAQAAPPAVSELKAVQAATVEATGPKSGDNGDKYFNIEGAKAGKFACFGLLRFDGAALKKELDSKYGEGKYKVANVTLQLTQSRAKFSKDGPVSIFYRADTTPNPKAPSLKYPYAPNDKIIGGSKIVVGTPAKTTAGTGTDENVVEAYNLTTDASGSGLKDALQAGKMITLILTAGDDSVAATYAGLKGVRQRKAPTLVVSLNK